MISYVAEDFVFLEGTNRIIKGIGGLKVHNIKKATVVNIFQTSHTHTKMKSYNQTSSEGFVY